MSSLARFVAIAVVLLLAPALHASPPPIDPTFSATLPPGYDYAEIAAVAPTGAILVNARLTPFPPTGSGFRILRLHPNGSLDTTFAPSVDAGQALAILPDGGALTSLPPYRLAADGGAASPTLPAGFDTTQPLDAALALTDGRFLLARGTRLARFRTDGSVDASFTFENTYKATITKLTLDAQNRVLAEMFFYYGPYSGETASLVIRLRADGSEDPAFARINGGYRTQVKIFPLANGDYLTFYTFEGGARTAFMLSDSAGNRKWSETYNGPFIAAFIVDHVARSLYVAGESPTRWSITTTGLAADPDFSLASATWTKPALQPDGRLLLVRDPAVWDGHTSPSLVRLATGPVFLANLSGRARTGDDENVVIAGLVIGEFDRPAAADTPVLLRGAGPALDHLGVAHPLANPAIDLFDFDGHRLGGATRWAPALDATFRTVGAFSFSPGSDDAAFALDLGATHATVLLRNENASAHGVGLVELYRVPSPAPSRQLLNLSFRARTAPGDDTAIAGFVLVDPEQHGRSARVLLRAVGPTLATQGVAHPLADPVLTVYDAHGGLVAQNDNWPSHLTADYNAFDAATDRVGAFHLLPDSKDSALLLDLPAGAYTLHATGLPAGPSAAGPAQEEGSAQEGGTGVVLLEIYLVR